jgi:cold shock CspA family protein
MASGVVKWFHSIMSYGIIAPDNGTAGVLIQVSAGESDRLGHLRKGDRLEYDTVRSADGRSLAVNLRAAEKARKPVGRPERT